ncbi:Kinase-interacting family protein [Actinidia chinensis var. chinensis]|uniref:Kinase-interacting family protein n=1 Tax=Actinidia chinensis var. chinensis TaxID=1590841 RepID=A0A2R6QID0_ACTCC|nr:Kinase-interacting family protein [Actinidia chinensis var. chinensis]
MEKQKVQAEAEAAIESSNRSCKARSRSRRRTTNFSKPSWLLSTIAELDERKKILTWNYNTSSSTREEEEKKAGDSFAERAEAYYLKRPQLLGLLDDLYNGYVSLADRYCQALAKHYHHYRQSSQLTAVQFEEQVDCYEEEEGEGTDGELVDSDVESSLSYQPPVYGKHGVSLTVDGDGIVVELVMKMVDYDILMNEMSTVEGRWSEWSRKAELQKSLLEVLESERVILLNENARLGYRVTALAEENKGLVTETLFMKRKAGELARCVLKMREDQRVFMLSRKIEDLQGQIYTLERKNKEEYYVKREYHNSLFQKFQHQEEAETGENIKSKTISNSSRGGEDRVNKVSKWWDRVKNFDLFLCGPHSNI